MHQAHWGGAPVTHVIFQELELISTPNKLPR
jgi:hypothetical protein